MRIDIFINYFIVFIILTKIKTFLLKKSRYFFGFADVSYVQNYILSRIMEDEKLCGNGEV